MFSIGDAEVASDFAHRAAHGGEADEHTRLFCRMVPAHLGTYYRARLRLHGLHAYTLREVEKRWR